MATECLSEYLEKDINSDEVKAVQEIKQKVQDKYRYFFFMFFLNFGRIRIQMKYSSQGKQKTTSKK